MEELLTLLGFAVNVAMWYFIFKFAMAIYEGYQTLKDAKEIHENVASDLDALVHNVKPEQHGEVLYWFDEDTDKFLAQGKDIAEIRTHLKERFKKDVFMISDKILMTGPEYEPMDISKLTPEEVAKHIAETVVPDLVKKHSEA